MKTAVRTAVDDLLHRVDDEHAVLIHLLTFVRACAAKLDRQLVSSST